MFLLTIDPHLFDLEAQIRFTWLVLKEFEFSNAVHHIHDSIKGMDRKFEEGTRYQASIVQALIEVLRLRMTKQHQGNFYSFMFNNQDTIEFCKDLLLDYQEQTSLAS